MEVVNVDEMYYMSTYTGSKALSALCGAMDLDLEKKKVKLVKANSFSNKFSQACGSVQKVDGELYVIGWGWATTDAECMSVYDFSTGEELMHVTLGDPQNITYRCVYYE